MGGSIKQDTACAGCSPTLQLGGNNHYVSMLYHLVLPDGLSVVIKDRAWFSKHLKQIMDEEVAQCEAPDRSFYLFDK